MAGPTFDPRHAVRFDLPRGSVTTGNSERHVILSCAALDDLVLIAGPEAAGAVGRSLGASIGQRVATRLGGAIGVSDSSIETVVAHLGGEMAVAGLGVLAIERWGRAMVVLVDRPAISDLPFLSAILEGALEAATSRPVRCVSLGRDGSAVRVLVGGASAVDRARTWLAEGAAWGDVLARLHAKGDGT